MWWQLSSGSSFLPSSLLYHSHNCYTEAPLPSQWILYTCVAAAEVPAVPMAALPSLLHTCTFVAAAEVPAVPVAPPFPPFCILVPLWQLLKSQLFKWPPFPPFCILVPLWQLLMSQLFQWPPFLPFYILVPLWQLLRSQLFQWLPFPPLCILVCTFVAAVEVPAVPVAALPSPLHIFAPTGRLKNRRRRLLYCCFP